MASERDVVDWVPVPGEENRKSSAFECLDDSVEPWDYLVPILDRERSAGTEIALGVDDQKRWGR